MLDIQYKRRLNQIQYPLILNKKYHQIQMKIASGAIVGCSKALTTVVAAYACL
jgi:hypothetical protein